MMQVVMHAQIATEEGLFKFPDVVSQIDAKLKRRHPHVFGDVQVAGTPEVLRNWEAIKAAERAENGLAHRSRMEGVPAILPSLARAQALGDRAARDGFDWPDLDGVLDKVGEELEELGKAGDDEARAAEMGDLLFALANVARWLGLDAESALRRACDRFARRYAEMELMAHSRSTRLVDLEAEALDDLWQAAKAMES
jgi:MazG family protein